MFCENLTTIQTGKCNESALFCDSCTKTGRKSENCAIRACIFTLQSALSTCELVLVPICQRESQRDKNPGGGRYVTYPQGLSAGHGESADGSFTIIIRQDVAIRQRTFLAFFSAWMIVNANSSSHSSCRCALSRVPFKRHTAASPKKLPATASVAGRGERDVKEKRVTTRVAL